MGEIKDISLGVRLYLFTNFVLNTQNFKSLNELVEYLWMLYSDEVT